MIVIDPRMTRTAAHATEYVRIRSGTDIPVIYGHALAHLQERLGGQGVHRAARLRHGRHPQGGREVDAGRGRARHRRAGRAARARRQDVRDREARDADLVHGRDPAHGRHRQRARVLHRAAGHRQCRQVRHRRQHLPRPHQRAGRDRPRPRYRDAAALLRPRRRRVAALVPRLGGRLRLVASPLRHHHRRRRQAGQDDEHARHPVDALVRRDAATPRSRCRRRTTSRP